MPDASPMDDAYWLKVQDGVIDALEKVLKATDLADGTARRAALVLIDGAKALPR